MIADGADRLPAGGCSPCKGRGSPWQCNHHIKKVKLEEDEDLVVVVVVFVLSKSDCIVVFL